MLEENKKNLLKLIFKTQITGRLSDEHLNFSGTSGRMSDTYLPSFHIWFNLEVHVWAQYTEKFYENQKAKIILNILFRFLILKDKDNFIKI